MASDHKGVTTLGVGDQTGYSALGRLSDRELVSIPQNSHS